MTVWINVDYEKWFALFAGVQRGIPRKGRRILLSEANAKTVAYWHRKIIPRHFDSSARSRYHYQRRKRRYRQIKEELAAGNTVVVNGQALPAENIVKLGRVDIVRGGKTETKAERRVAIFATEHKAVASLKVPRHIVSRRRGTRPNMAKEIQSVTKAEKGRMVTIWKKTFLAGVRVYGNSIMSKRKRFVSRS